MPFREIFVLCDIGLFYYIIWIKKMIRYLIFPLFLLGSLSSAFSQVRGIVKDIAGEPIIGANVFWLGTTTGTTTGESGKFSLPETGTSDKLVVRFVGYRSDTIHIDRVDTPFGRLFYRTVR